MNRITWFDRTFQVVAGEGREEEKVEKVGGGGGERGAASRFLNDATNDKRLLHFVPKQ